MTLTQSSTRFAALTIGAAAIVAVAFSAAFAAPAHAAVCPGTTFSTNLKLGNTSAAVMALQQFLNMSADTQVAATGAGSPGAETSYFGGLTKAAVNKFQAKYAAQILTPLGLSTPTGNFYAASQAQANAVCAGSVTTTPPTGTGSGTAVVSAAAQPANTIAPKGAARVPFTAFTVTANGAPVTLNSVTVQRQGPSVDTDFAGVVLIDASTGVQVGNSRVLDANHSASIGSTIVIPAGTSKTFWVAGNISTTLTTSGDIASFAVTAINTASTVSGSLPITGASNTINASLNIGTAQISNSSFDPDSASIQPIGTTGYRFSGIRVNAGSVEDVTFKSITWYQAGSASGMQNVMTVVNGTSYPTTADATGRYYTTVFPNGIVIAKGNSVDAYVQADLGANTTASTVAEFDIYRNTDIYLTGNQYGYGITPTITGTQAATQTTAAHDSSFNLSVTGNPFFQGSTVAVTAGTFSTIQNATSVGAQNVATNVNNQVLGGFQTNLTGEGITVQSLKVTFNTSAGALATTTNVSLVDENGATVAGPFDSVWTGLNTQTVTFTGSINFPVGTHTYTLKGKIASTAVTGATIYASTNPSVDWTNVTGNTTGNNVTPSVGNFNMSTMTVKAAGLSVGNSATPTSQTVVAGGSNVLFANFQLDATQSGEDVRISSLPVSFTGTGAASSTLSNCQLWNGSTALNTGSRVVNSNNITSGSITFSFDNSLTIPKGTVVTLGLTCNLSSSAINGTTYNFALNSTPSNYSASGVTSGSSVTVAVQGGSAPTMTISTGGGLAVATDSSAPSYTLVAGGTTGVTANVIKFRATNEAVNLTKVGLTLTNSASSTAADLTTVELYAGNNIMTTGGVAIAANTKIGTATFLGNATFATSTLDMAVQLPKDQDATIIVKASIADIGSNQAGTEGHLVAIDYLNSQGTGANSGTNVYGTAGVTSGVAGLRIFNTFPIVALDTTQSSNTPAGGVLMQFKVTADSHGSLGLDKFTFNIATSTASVTNIVLNAYTDSGYSQAVSGTYGATTGQFGSTLTSVATASDFSISATTNALQVSAGQTVYFKLSGSVAGATSGASVTTKLVGDSAYPSLPGFMAQVGSLGSSKFIWSPNATTTANITGDNDWTNGYGVQGLPASGLIKTLSQ